MEGYVSALKEMISKNQHFLFASVYYKDTKRVREARNELEAVCKKHGLGLEQFIKQASLECVEPNVFLRMVACEHSFRPIMVTDIESSGSVPYMDTESGDTTIKYSWTDDLNIRGEIDCKDPKPTERSCTCCGKYLTRVSNAAGYDHFWVGGVKYSVNEYYACSNPKCDIHTEAVINYLLNLNIWNDSDRPKSIDRKDYSSPSDKLFIDRMRERKLYEKLNLKKIEALALKSELTDPRAFVALNYLKGELSIMVPKTDIMW